ncbi:hypothetical protein GQ457_05G023200 [Hibiscus cannabinus]
MTRANPTALEYQFEPEIERVCRRNRKEFRAMADPPNNQNAANNNQIAAAGQVNPPLAVPPVQARNRPIRDHLLPDLENLNPGIVTPEIQATQFELKPVMFNMLYSIGQFGGLTHEDARQHLRSFIEVCDLYRQQGVHDYVLRLKLFPYSLREKARAWFNSIPSGSVESWDDLCRNFIIRYSSTVLTDKLRNGITSFRQTDDESMYEAWDRYKELFRKCPMHGFNEWTKVIMFYNGVNAPTRMMLDASANGTLLDKSAKEATEILDRLANNDYQFPSTRKGMTRRNVRTYELEPTDAISAQLAALTNMNPESSFYVGNFNRNNNPYSNTYNPRWKQHPNFSWNNQRNPSNTIRQNAEASGFQQNMPRQQNQLPQQQPPSTKIRMQGQEATLKSLETQVGQFAQMLSARPQGNLPSNTEVARGQGYEQCKVIITRSRTKASNEAIQVEENEQLSNEENESPEIATAIPHATMTKDISISDATTSSHVVASSSHNAKPDEVSKEAIEKMSNYAKFLKDIVSKRTRLSEFETVAMTKGCMAMLHNRLPSKLKDPGSFTIPCAIGNHYVGKALCDLGASINLMPKSVFERLGIGKARPTTVMLQLADRSYIQPEGKIEDILIRVDKFIFPADFIVVDCEADKFATIILGRPFLATGRTLIDVEKGQLTMRVNEQQVTLDVFRALKRSDNPEECHNVNVIDAELETYCRDHYLTAESESENFKEQKPNEAAQQEENRVLSQLGKNFKFLDHSSKEISTPKTFIEQQPTLRTSPMLEQLKYDHLENDNTLPITLSFELQHEQENRLIDTLVRQKEGASIEIHDEIAMTSSKQLLQQVNEQCLRDYNGAPVLREKNTNEQGLKHYVGTHIERDKRTTILGDA